MADDVIKEFLVGLGFKTDEKELKNFTAGIDTATKAVTRLVTTIVGASLTVAAGVSAFASNLEGLYFASQRIGASAESIRASEHAARDFGSSADEARGALEGVASFLRSTPGASSYLKGLGVQTHDINGNLRDTGDVLVDLGRQFKGMDYWLAEKYAGTLGISENMLRTIMQDGYAAEVEKNRKRLARSGMDQATKDSHEFMKSLRDVGEEFEILSVQVQAALMREFGPELKKFATWLEHNSPMIAERVVDVVDALIELGKDAGPYLEKLWEYFVELDEATGGWSTKIIALLVLLKALGAGSLVKAIASLASEFFRLGKGIASADKAAAATGVGSRFGAGPLGALLVGIGALLYSPTLNDGEDEIVQRIREEMGLPPAEEQTAQQKTNENVAAEAARRLMGIDMNDVAQYSDYLQHLGASAEAAMGMLANAVIESNLDPKAMGDGGLARGIFQLHPPRQQDFKKFAGFGIGDERATALKQLEFAYFEATQGAEKKNAQLMVAAKNARIAGEAGSRDWIRPGLLQSTKDREAALRGEVAMQMNTTINVNGAGDPAAVGRSVAGEQTRVGAEVARNMNTPEVN